MTDFFDWLTVSDSGLGADRLAEAFNLSREEVRGTAEALAPAFTLALQRAMTDPSVWRDLSRKFAPIYSLPLAPGPETAESAAARDLSDTLFGSPEISASLARKVSLARGIAPDAVEQLMRNLSLMTMHTMVQMMLANMARSQPKGLAEGDYPTAMAEMMRRAANAVEALARPSQSASERRFDAAGMKSPALANLFADALNGRLSFPSPLAEGSTGSQAAPDRAPVGEGTSASTPFEVMMDGFMRGFAPGRDADGSSTETGGSPAAPDPSSARQPNEMRGDGPATGSGAPHDDAVTTGRAELAAFDDLARVGRKMQDDYTRQMMQLFDVRERPETGPTKH